VKDERPAASPLPAKATLRLSKEAFKHHVDQMNSTRLYQMHLSSRRRSWPQSFSRATSRVKQSIFELREWVSEAGEFLRM
jgi:hypothetical protein